MDITVGDVCQDSLLTEHANTEYVAENGIADMEYLEDFYDEIWIPDELHGVHFKNVITKRNEWFVNNSDLLVAYVLRDKGGAATCFKMAKKQEISVVNIAENKNTY